MQINRYVYCTSEEKILTFSRCGWGRSRGENARLPSWLHQRTAVYCVTRSDAYGNASPRKSSLRPTTDKTASPSLLLPEDEKIPSASRFRRNQERPERVRTPPEQYERRGAATEEHSKAQKKVSNVPSNPQDRGGRGVGAERAECHGVIQTRGGNALPSHVKLLVGMNPSRHPRLKNPQKPGASTRGHLINPETNAPIVFSLQSDTQTYKHQPRPTKNPTHKKSMLKRSITPPLSSYSRTQRGPPL